MNTRKHNTANGFTLVELLVVISIIALLLSIMMPALGRAREQGRMLVDSSNLKQLGMGWRFYANDNRDTFPVGMCWWKNLAWWLDGTGVGNYLPTKTRWGSTNSQPGQKKAVWPGWYCTKNVKLALETKERFPASNGTATGYQFNYNLGYDRYTKVAAIPNASSVPHMFCFWDSNPIEKETSGAPAYMGNYFSTAGDPEINETTYRAFRFMAGVKDVHGKGLGTNFMFVDSHLERVTPMSTQLKYARKFKWEIPANAYTKLIRNGW